MTFYTASFETVVLRFCLMMATILVPFMIDIPVLAILSLPIFLAAMTAVSFKKKEDVIESNATIIKQQQANKAA